MPPTFFKQHCQMQKRELKMRGQFEAEKRGLVGGNIQIDFFDSTKSHYKSDNIGISNVLLPKNVVR